MKLTEAGKSLFNSTDVNEKNKAADSLCNGSTDINIYTEFGVCYEVVAYLRCLLGSQLDINTLLGSDSKDWPIIILLNDGNQWTNGDIDIGTAVGFGRVIKENITWFHAAIATGGTTIRSVNGNALGNGWSQLVNLSDVLINPDNNGYFNYDNAPTIVTLSPF